MGETFALSPDEAARRAQDEAARLVDCATEPIRTIGRIQGYGFLLGVDETTGVVVLASANAEQHLGTVLRDEHAPLAGILSHATAVDPVRTEFDGELVDVIVHRGTAPLLVEFEPVIPELEYMRTGVVGAIQRLAAVTDVDGLYATAAREIKSLTGFDRVMVYDFHEDGHGQVVADEREPDMEPYFGLHFPASDIPVQARALYLEKRSRVIADTEGVDIPVLTLLPEEEPIDLGPSELRAVSPHHLAFMRNMGQASTFSLSLVDNGRLVGLMTCAHRTPRRLPVMLRRALEVFATQVSSQLASLRRIHGLQRKLDAQERRAAVISALFMRADAGEALTTGEHTVLDIVPSDGAVLRLRNEVHTVGVVPPPDDLLAVVDGLGPGRHVTESLSLDDPEGAARVPGVAGLIVVPLDDDGDVLVFVRGEVAQTIDWLGDQRPENRDGALSPRRSFSAWRESVAGRSLPWGDHRHDAFDFGKDLQTALNARAQAELAELALRDPLTGLYNRRFLDDLLRDMSPSAHGAMSVVFLDVDDFKAVNDTHGHDTGDVVLSVLAQRLESVVRDSDWVIRLGGDEFLIVCPGTGLPQARGIAERALFSLAQPIHVGGITITVHVSGGVVAGGAEQSVSDVVTSADAAMYRAKKAGGARISA